MTRKHFEAIARAIAVHRQHAEYCIDGCDDTTWERALDTIADSIATELSAIYPKFNAERFEEATK